MSEAGRCNTGCEGKLVRTSAKGRQAQNSGRARLPVLSKAVWLLALLARPLAAAKASSTSLRAVVFGTTAVLQETVLPVRTGLSCSSVLLLQEESGWLPWQALQWPVALAAHGHCKLHLDLRDRAGATEGAGMLQPSEVLRACDTGPRQAEGKDLTRDACGQWVHGLSTDGCQHHREAPLHSAMGQMWPPSLWGPLPHPGSQPHHHLAKAGCLLRLLEPSRSF